MSFEDWPADIETLVDEKVANVVYDNESFIRNVAEEVVDEADIDGRVQEYIDNNIDFSDQVEEALRYRTFDSDDIEDFDSRVEYIVDGIIEDKINEIIKNGEADGSLWIQRLDAVKAENEALRNILNNVAKVLTGEATLASFSDPVPAFPEQQAVTTPNETPEFVGAAI